MSHWVGWLVSPLVGRWLVDWLLVGRWLVGRLVGWLVDEVEKGAKWLKNTISAQGYQ